MGSDDPPFSEWPFAGTSGLTRWAPVREHLREIAAISSGKI
ncbi:hypothetical protein [Mesorhizobium sp. BH1-1-5]|nr:hypothetical protein [Mesorhizobium sp. BH1-1-5]